MRKLASIQRISAINPIEGADAIEVATINAWKVVVKKGEFTEGDPVVYFEIDSFLPIEPEFEFLRKSSFKSLPEGDGFRLRTIKLRGQVSQGLVISIHEFSKILARKLPETAVAFSDGQDVSNLLGVTKYEPPIPACLSGKIKGNFPSFIPKTDEERIQNLSDVYENFKKNLYYVTEKLDGSSATFYYNNGIEGVCSRNIDLLESEGNSFWEQARLLKIHDILKTIGNYAIQGELVGSGIQGNKYKLNKQDVFFFNLFDIDKQEYVSMPVFIEIMRINELKTVPIIDMAFQLPDTIDDLLKYAEGSSVLHPTQREGVVLRNTSRTISFKAISNEFLMKNES